MRKHMYGAAAALISAALCLSSCGTDIVSAMETPRASLTPANTRATRETMPVETIMAVAHDVEDVPMQAGEEFPAEDTTAPPSEVRVPHTAASVTTKEKPITNRIYLQGPNMVYVGESFDYTYTVSSRNADRATVVWSVDGDAGTLGDNGRFTAERSGEVTLTVSDISNGLTDSLLVHCVDTPMDVDFVVTVNGIPIANKTYPVPRDYMPMLDPEAEAAYLRLYEDSSEEGLSITFNSGFRSFDEQLAAYTHWNEMWGNEEADRVSARPGHSEHQLGLAIDVCNVTKDFAETPEAEWLGENCWRYGFILRYPSYESEPITGYAYEPWHIRYLGEELAADVAASGLTLEEYLGIDSYYRMETFEDEFGYSLFGDETEEGSEN